MRTSKNWRVSFHFEGPLPLGISLSESGVPLYPDPLLYPPEVIRAYNGWIELTNTPDGLSYRRINPSDQRFLQAPTIRSGDFVCEVHSLLGKATADREFWDDENLFAEFYSKEIMVAYKKDTEEVEGVHVLDSSGTHYKKWNFVFVDPALVRGVESS